MSLSWQNATAYILDDVEKTHKNEKLMHSFWRVYYENNTARLLSEIFALKLYAIDTRIKPNRVLFYMGNTINGKIGRELSTLNIVNGN